METILQTYYFYPNETVVWSLMIVLYPFISGMVAGTFITGALSKAFGIAYLEPIFKPALVASVSFLCFATLPLMLHLEQPTRAAYIFITPHLTSAMSGFGYIYMGFLVLVIVMIWYAFRPNFVAKASSGGLKGVFYKLICLGVTKISKASYEHDQKVIKALAVIGIPFACILTGYVGFVFAAVKTNMWWSSALTPVVFILSAMVCGLAFTIILYHVHAKLTKTAVSSDCVRGLVRYLWGFLLFAITLELLELLHLAYYETDYWSIIREMLEGNLAMSYWGAQVVVGGVIPLLLLSYILFVNVSERTRSMLAYFSSFLLILQVFSMRWNVVIGGQLLSKTYLGVQEWNLEIGGREGLVAGVMVVLAPVVLLAILRKWLLTDPEVRPGSI
ncbi:MAG: polysulfide reductase NrfD [Planctomycetes bacterium]|nr:polysulfide reductase NrfD [Planctomycetota bacterium]